MKYADLSILGSWIPVGNLEITLTDLVAILVVASDCSVFIEHHGGIHVVVADIAVGTMLGLTFEFLSAGDTPPFATTFEREVAVVVVAAAVAHVTPDLSVGGIGVPLPGLLTVVADKKFDFGSQVGSHFHGELLLSHHLFAILVDIAEIQGLIGV